MFITSKGWALSNQLEPIGEQLLQDALADMPDRDREHLQVLLELFRSNLQAIDENDAKRKPTANG